MGICKIGYANTKASTCQKDMGKLMKCIVTPLNAEFTGLDESNNDQTFTDWLFNGIHAADPAKRFYPMPDFINIEDKSSDNTTYTTGYGDEIVISQGKVNFNQEYSPDFCLTARLTAFNDNSPRRVIIIDGNNDAWGTTIGGYFKGYKMRVYASLKKTNPADSINNPTISYSSMASNEFVKKDYRNLDVEYDSLNGLQDIMMEETQNGTNTEIVFVDKCSGDDITSELQPLSGKSDAWLIDGVPGTTAPTYADGKFTIATTSITGKKLQLAPPNVLFDLGVTEKECQNIILVA